MKTKIYKILIFISAYFLFTHYNLLSGQKGVSVKVLMDYSFFGGSNQSIYFDKEKLSFRDRTMYQIEVEKELSKRFKTGLGLGYGRKTLTLPYNDYPYDVNGLNVDLSKVVLSAGVAYRLDKNTFFYLHYGLCFYRTELNGSLINRYHGAETILNDHKLNTKTDDVIMFKFEHIRPIHKNTDLVLALGGRFFFNETLIEEYLEYSTSFLFTQLGLRYTVF